MSVRFILRNNSQRPVNVRDVQHLSIFREHPEAFANGVYRVRSDVNDADFDLFLDALFDGCENISVTRDNAKCLKQLAEELGFTKLQDKVLEFEEEDLTDAHKQPGAYFDRQMLEEYLSDYDIQIQQLQMEIAFLKDDLLQATVKSEVLERKVATAEQKLKESQLIRSNDLIPLTPSVSVPFVVAAPSKGTMYEISEMMNNESHIVQQLQRLSGKDEMMHDFIVDCPPGKGPFRGILSYLRGKCGGNVHQRGLVEITASSNGLHQCYQVVDDQWGRYWISKHEPRRYIQFDFKDSRVCVTAYSLKSGDGPGRFSPWVLAASDDGEIWVTIDNQLGGTLEGGYKVKMFTCNEPSDKMFRYIRLSQTDGYGYMRLAQIEFFGKLLDYPRSVKDKFMSGTRGMEILYDQDPFRGVFSYLRDLCGGNVHEKGLVVITGTTTGQVKPEQVVDYGWNIPWCSTNEPNSSLTFRFLEYELCLGQYSIKGPPFSNPWQWVVEASRDETQWITLDGRNTQDLNGKYTVKTYSCSRKRSDFFQFFRLRQTGPNSAKNNYFSISEIEFFGTLRPIERGVTHFPFQKKLPLKGVLAALRKHCGGNPHTEQLVTITGNTASEGKPCSHVVESDNVPWVSTDEPDSHIQFDFMQSQFSVEEYTIKSAGSGMSHPIAWSLEGSNDATTWTPLDSQDTHDLCGSHLVKTFDCSRLDPEFFRYIRLRQTGKNSTDGDSLVLNEIDFFGHLRGFSLVEEEGEDEKGVVSYPLKNDPANGIFAALYEKCGNNPIDMGIIEITASSNTYTFNFLCQPKWDSMGYSNDEPRSFVQFDFKTAAVNVKAYTIKSSSQLCLDEGLRGCCILEWIVEGSQDGTRWTQIDERKLARSDGSKMCVYKCQERRDFFRFVRLVQTGKNSKGNDCLCLTKFELFGNVQYTNR